MLQVKIPKAFQRIFEAHRYKVFFGGRGSGKSQSVARYLLLEGVRQPMRILCAREFQASIKESVKQLLEDLINEMGLSGFYDVLTTEIRGKNGASFVFAGLRHNIANIKSMHDITKCWVEEAQAVSDNSWSVLIPTIRAEGSEIILTLNPELEEDPTSQRFIIDPPKDALLVKVNYEANPYFPEVLRKEMESLKEKDEEEYRHVWLGEFRASVAGAIYAQHLQKARDEGRIGDYPYDSRYPVSVFFDIGWGDHTSICFVQFIQGRLRFIDAYQNQFQKTPHYVGVLQEKKYNYDRIVLPHDGDNEHANADRTWVQIVRSAFPNANVYAGERRAVALRLEATKNMLDTVEINKPKCQDLLSALAHYHFAIDPVTGKTTREPFHGNESNYADSFGYACLEAKAPSKPRIKREASPIYRGH